MNHTFFVNPHGLDSKEARSTVNDLAILMKTIYSSSQETEFSEIMPLMGRKQYVGEGKAILGKETILRDI